ncbi:MAG: hypothetical protein WAV05_08875, partial [Anaerolineales bacterium]
MTTNEMNTSTNQQLEETLVGYFSLYTAEPEYRSALQKLLLDKSSKTNLMHVGRRDNSFFKYLRYRPTYKWIAAASLIILIFIMLIVIRPVRAAIERLIDFGYLEGAGFVRVSETYVLPGPVYSMRPKQTIVVDRVIADPQKTVVWLRVTGNLFAPEEMNSASFATMEVNRQSLPSFSSLVSYGEGQSEEEAVYQFSSLGSGNSSPFILHLSPGWDIPVSLIPMSSMDQSQTTTIYPHECQTQLGVELCLRTFISDSTGYHLWLSASSSNPILYLQDLYLHNPLTGEDPILIDSSGHQLDPVYSSELPIVIQESPVITDAIQEVRTTLSFERSANESGSLELLVGGLTSKTPADDTIVCGLGNDPQIGDKFPCEKSISIAGEQIRFHEGEITQHSDGIHLTVLSDPIQASNGLLVTFVSAESLNYENSSLVGIGFNPRTNQLEIWLGLDSLSAKNQFAVKIT